MTLPERVLAGETEVLDEETLLAYVQLQRWFGAKAEDVAHAAVLDAAVLRGEVPLLVSALTETRFHTGTHQTYQLLLGLRPADDGWRGGTIAEREGFVVYDAPSDPELARELVELMRSEATLAGRRRMEATSSRVTCPASRTRTASSCRISSRCLHSR